MIRSILLILVLLLVFLGSWFGITVVIASDGTNLVGAIIGGFFLSLCATIGFLVFLAGIGANPTAYGGSNREEK